MAIINVTFEDVMSAYLNIKGAPGVPPRNDEELRIFAAFTLAFFEGIVYLHAECKKLGMLLPDVKIAYDAEDTSHTIN